MHPPAPIVGKCIYCLKGSVPLSDEHIIPKGLGGALLLKKASCRECQEITRRFEGECQRRHLGIARAKLRMPTRHKGERPNTFPIRVKLKSGEEREVIVPIEKFPLMMALPVLPVAKISLNLPSQSSDKVEGGGFWTILPKSENLQRAFGALEVTEYIGPSVSIRTFARMLAKIAYCKAVYDFGCDNIEPYVVDLILGKYIRDRNFDVNYYIGSMPPDVVDKKSVHRVRVNVDKGGFVTVYIWLFAALGAPVYHVVVGKLINMTTNPRHTNLTSQYKSLV